MRQKDPDMRKQTDVLTFQEGKRRLKELNQQPKAAVLFFCVVDQFQWVEETFGALEAEWMLRFITEGIWQELSDPDFVFLLGRERFAVALYGRSREQGEEEMKRIWESFDKRRGAGGFFYEIGFSYESAGEEEGKQLAGEAEPQEQ